MRLCYWCYFDKLSSQLYVYKRIFIQWLPDVAVISHNEVNYAKTMLYSWYYCEKFMNIPESIKIFSTNVRYMSDSEDNLMYIEYADCILSCLWCEIPSAYVSRELRLYTSFTLMFSMNVIWSKFHYKCFRRVQITISDKHLSHTQKKKTDNQFSRICASNH